MVHRFTSAARNAVRDAQQEARAARSTEIGAPHLLLGILTEPEGMGGVKLRELGVTVESMRARIADPADGLDAEALATLGIDLDQVRSITEAAFGKGALAPRNRTAPKPGHMPIGDDMKQVLVAAVRQREELKQPSIGTGHLLLGMLNADRADLTNLLRDSGVDADSLRTVLLARLESSNE